MVEHFGLIQNGVYKPKYKNHDSSKYNNSIYMFYINIWNI